MSISAGRYSLRPRVKGRVASSRRRPSSSSPSSETAAERLPDDLLVEILSRVPLKSICRFKCVSKHWLGLIDHPEYRGKLPQTLAGFFYNGESGLQFTNVSGRSPPLIDTGFAFLPSYRLLELLDCCNGLLLCHVSTQSDEFRYIVCNPATEKWVMLPDSGQAGEVDNARLGFDPAVSPHFHVFVLLEDQSDERYITGVDVYSSETGRWIRKKRGWVHIGHHGRRGLETVFLDGYLHFYCYDYEVSWPCVAAVHTDGETWMHFDPPYYVYDGFLQKSQGRLHYAGFKRDEDGFQVLRLVVYVYDDDNDNEEWTLKHSVEILNILEINVSSFDWIAIHPDGNLIFFTMGPDNVFMCYNMDHQQAKVICNLGECEPQYLPYVPLYAELRSLHM